jgi:hypothetical protein
VQPPPELHSSAQQPPPVQVEQLWQQSYGQVEGPSPRPLQQTPSSQVSVQQSRSQPSPSQQ